MNIMTKLECFGKEFKEEGIFCRVCGDKIDCQKSQMVNNNTPKAPHTNTGNTMFEVHTQTAPTLVKPQNGAVLTPEMAVGLVKKHKSNGETEETKTIFRAKRWGRRSNLKIPYEAGSAKYSKAYYWCRKLDKTFPEIEADFEAGKLTTHHKARAEPKPAATEVPLAPPKPIPPPAAQPPPKPNIPASTDTEEELIKYLKATSTVFSAMNIAVAAMDNNIQEMRKEITLLRGEMKRIGGGKH